MLLQSPKTIMPKSTQNRPKRQQRRSQRLKAESSTTSIRGRIRCNDTKNRRGSNRQHSERRRRFTTIKAEELRRSSNKNGQKRKAMKVDQTDSIGNMVESMEHQEANQPLIDDLCHVSHQSINNKTYFLIKKSHLNHLNFVFIIKKQHI